MTKQIRLDGLISSKLKKTPANTFLFRVFIPDMGNQASNPAEKVKKTSPLTKMATEIACGGGITFAGRIIGTGIRYCSQICAAWLLGVKLFGIYSLGMAFYQLIGLLAELGLEEGGIRYISIYRDQNDIKKLKGVLLSVIKLPFIAGCILGCIVFFSSGYISQLFSKPELAYTLRIFAVAIPFGASMIVTAFATTGFHITTYLVYIVHIIQPGINLLMIILLCGLGYGLYGATAAWCIAMITGLLFSIYFIWKLFPEIISKSIKPIYDYKKLLYFSIPLLSGSFLWVAIIWTDILMLGMFRPSEEVGAYRAASQTALLASMIVSSLDTIFAPKIANLYSNNKINDLNDMFQIATRWGYSFTLPLFLILGISAGDVLHIFGENFGIGATALVILGGGQLINGATGSAGAILIMSGHQMVKMAGDIILAISNIILNFFLIPKLGMTGAAIATTIGISITNILYVVLVYCFLKIQPYNIKYIKVTIAGLFACGTGILLHNVLISYHFILSFLMTATGISIIYIFFVIMMGMEESDRIVLNNIIKKYSTYKEKI